MEVAKQRSILVLCEYWKCKNLVQFLLPNPGRILPKSSSRSKLNFDSRKAAQHDPITICSSCKVRSCSKHSDRKLAALHESLVGETHGERATTTTTTTTRLRATLIQRKRRRPESSEFIDITKNLQNTTVPTLSKHSVMEILRIHRCNLNLQNTNIPTLSKHVVMEILRIRRYY